jgi:hypothetical protein
MSHTSQNQPWNVIPLLRSKDQCFFSQIVLSWFSKKSIPSTTKTSTSWCLSRVWLMSHIFSYKYPLYNGTLFNVFSNLCYCKSLSHTSILENIKDYVYYFGQIYKVFQGFGFVNMIVVNKTPMHVMRACSNSLKSRTNIQTNSKLCLNGRINGSSPTICKFWGHDSWL